MEGLNGRRERGEREEGGEGGCVWVVGDYKRWEEVKVGGSSTEHRSGSMAEQSRAE